MNQRDIDNAIRGQLGIGGANQSTPNRTPRGVVNRMINTSKDASAINPNAQLGGGGAPIGPEDFKPTR